MRNFLKFLVLGGILVSPFIFELSKPLFIRTWIEAVLTFGLVFVKRNPDDNKRDPLLIRAILALSAVAVLSSFFGADLQKSWAGNFYRGDGLYTFLHFFALVIFLTYYLKKDWLVGIIKTIAVSVIGLSSLSVGTWILINIFGRYELQTWVDSAIGLSFGNPNFLTGYLLLGLASTLSLFPLALLLIIPAIFLTQAWAGVFGIIIFLILWILTGKNKYKLGIATLLIVTILAGAFFYTKQTFSPHESRQIIYQKGVEAFIKRPVTGFGWANFDYASGSSRIDKAHSSILEVATTTGMVGLGLYLFIIIRSILNLLKRKEAIYRIILVTFLVITIHMQTNVISISEELIFWIFVALAATRPLRATPQEESV